MAAPLKPIARRALAAQSDERLVRLFREGHDPAFDEIVRRYRSSLVAFAAAITGASRAEDVVQAALLRAHRALTTNEREIRLRAWLFTIVRNGALNAVRDDPAWSELDPTLHEASETAATAEQREDLGRLINAICALPESQRQALVMREMEGVGHAEIAAALETSPTAVRGLIFRARTTLRNALGALVPLPILRWLLEDAAMTAAAGAAATAGAGGGAAAGGALAGGVFGKAAVGLTAAVVAVGAGKAIDDRRSDRDRSEGDPAAAIAATGTGGQSGLDGPGADDGGSPVGSALADDRHERQLEGAEAREDRRDDRDPGDGDGADPGPGGGSGPGSSGGASGSGPSGGSGGGGGESGGGHSGDDDDNSGSGGGHSGDDDDSSGSSGHGDSDDEDEGSSGSSGHGGHSGDDPETEVEEPEDDDLDEPEVEDVDEPDDSDSDDDSSGSGSGSDD